MKLAIDRLLSDGLRLELPNVGSGPDLIALERGANVRGVYGQDAEAFTLEGFAADELAATSVVWHLGEGSRIETQVALASAAIDLRIARGVLHGRHRVLGTLATRELRGSALAYTTPTLEVGMVRLEVADLRIAFGPGTLEVTAARLALEGGRLQVGGASVSFGAAMASGVRLSRSGDAMDATAEAIELTEVVVEAGAAKLRAARARVVAPSYAGGNVALAALEIDEADVDVSFDEAVVEPAAPRAASPAAPIDLSFLDRLSGEVNVDLQVDARIPVIKRRTATHRFRVPIDRGTIDYHELERDLAGLEDAVLDFALKGDRLVFQKDIPLIPFDEETIVYWSLDDDEIPLAKQKRVRLRRLADVKQPERPPKKKSDEPSSFEILRLDLEPVDARLRLDGDARIDARGAAVRLGDAGRPAIEELRVTGAVRHRPGQAPQPGELRVEARAIQLAIDRLPISNRVASAAALEIAAIAGGTLDFRGIRVVRLRGAIQGVRTRELRLAYT